MTKEKDQLSVEFIFSLTTLVTALPHILCHTNKDRNKCIQKFSICLVLKIVHSLLFGRILFHKSSYKQSTASNFVTNTGYINKLIYIRMANNLNCMNRKYL